VCSCRERFCYLYTQSSLDFLFCIHNLITKIGSLYCSVQQNSPITYLKMHTKQNGKMLNIPPTNSAGVSVVPCVTPTWFCHKCLNNVNTVNSSNKLQCYCNSPMDGTRLLVGTWSVSLMVVGLKWWAIARHAKQEVW